MINYPNRKKRSNKEVINYSNRGIDFEYEINQSNEYYRENDIAFIFKKPTPIKVVKVDSKDKHKINEAYFAKKSTTDYNGLYKGYYIDFEAKECNKNTFNVGSNLKDHQLNHLINIDKNDGIALLMVRFSSKDKTFFLPVRKINQKSISYEYFEKEGYEIRQGINPMLSYIEALDCIIIKEYNG